MDSTQTDHSHMDCAYNPCRERGNQAGHHKDCPFQETEQQYQDYDFELYDKDQSKNTTTPVLPRTQLPHDDAYNSDKAGCDSNHLSHKSLH